MLVQVLMQWMVVMLLEFFLLLSSNCSEATTKEPGSSCSPRQFVNGSTYESNRRQLFSSFQVLSGSNNSHTSTYGETSNRIFGLYQCDKDAKTKDDCYFCITDAEDTIRKVCHQAENAYVWRDNCFLRYGKENFTSTLDKERETICEGIYNGSRPSENMAYVVDKLFVEMKKTHGTKTAAAKDDLAANGKAVCSSDLASNDCERCLQESKLYAKKICSRNTEVDIWSGSCRLNYHISYSETVPLRGQGTPSKTNADNTSHHIMLGPFPSIAPITAITQTAAANPPGHSNSNTWVMWGTVAAVFVLLSVCALAVAVVAVRQTNMFGWRWRWLRNNRRFEDITEDFTEIGSGLAVRIFPYELLRQATRNFDDMEKLGEGAYGSVYKGTLPDDTVIAVKKLNAHSKQGNDQFLNEANLISNVQHRNLVRLLGCCAEKSDRLLVYEYLPNKSLDKILFSADLSATLNWSTRKSITVGVARGLAYLHEESQPRIVHRDIKAGNVLLDENYKAKISDFGLARLFPEFGTHVSTRVAGTFGYLAPEYALRGQLTEKADIFSFGILALEIISGRPNLDITLSPSRHFMLEWAWKLYEVGDSWRIVDPNIDEDNSREDVERSINIAFLCVQATAHLRPKMSEVVAMISSTLPIDRYPQKPAFLELSEGERNSGNGNMNAAAVLSYSTSHGGAASSSLSSDISSLEPR